MKLSSKTTIIVPEKLYDYLLNHAHLDGASKAKFLAEIGYNQRNHHILEMDLRNQHLSLETLPGKLSIFGTKYEIVAPLVGPNGKKRWVRSIWMIRRGEETANFITLVPEKKP